MKLTNALISIMIVCCLLAIVYITRDSDGSSVKAEGTNENYQSERQAENKKPMKSSIESNSSMALLLPGYSTLEELVASTSEIIVVRLPEDYGVVRTPFADPTMVEVGHLYPLEVKEQLKGNFSETNDPEESIDLVVPIGLQQVLSDSKSGISPYLDQPIDFKGGEYLLFVEKSRNRLLKKDVLVPNTFHHIYRKDGNHYVNISSELVPEIDGDLGLLKQIIASQEN
ncbi:hypothetical protein [Paenisporosarcina cavernae]|uniref:Uncharacterized protein n=1 Tax=Paenisporosarcina cavernae TaxID=2320858 RepID=A0A385YXF9_9BACL|nr:hypothetical protein [Paenisporosarcina cavernae]AYC30253.1 hypothetical protein D3873_10460 [Paenisporosarcina cavernae]